MFFALVSILPFVRSCGDVSLGFPTVSFELGKPHWFNLIPFATNLIFLIIFSFLLVTFFKNKSSKAISFGVGFVIFYHAYYLFGYLIYLSSVLGFLPFKLMDLTLGILQVTIYPFLLVSNYFPIEKTFPIFYTDKLDITFRICYLVSVLLWFFVGFLSYKTYGWIKGRKSNSH